MSNSAAVAWEAPNEAGAWADEPACGAVYARYRENNENALNKAVENIAGCHANVYGIALQSPDARAIFLQRAGH